MATYKITVKEVSKSLPIEVEADSYEKAKEKAEEMYFADPNAYVLEPYDTFFE